MAEAAGSSIALISAYSKCGEGVGQALAVRLRDGGMQKNVVVVNEAKVEGSAYGQVVLGGGNLGSLDEVLAAQVAEAVSAERQRVAGEVASQLSVSVDLDSASTVQYRPPPQPTPTRRTPSSHHVPNGLQEPAPGGSPACGSRGVGGASGAVCDGGGDPRGAAGGFALRHAVRVRAQLCHEAGGLPTGARHGGGVRARHADLRETGEDAGLLDHSLTHSDAVCSLSSAYSVVSSL